jgi:putative membrane protein
MQMTGHERTTIASRVAAVEARTGTQVVTAVVGKSDSYPEAPWKAFALGAGIAALACAMWQLGGAGWTVDGAQLAHVLVILAGVAFLALLSVYCAPFARLFIDRARRELEVMQLARSLFFEHGLYRTRGHVGVLVFVSLFERRVVVLADSGFDGRMDAADWDRLTRRITLLLRHATTAVALRAGLDAMEAMLLERGFCGPATANELPDAVLQMKDAR